MARDNPYPGRQEIANAKAGDLLLKPGEYQVGGERFEADYGMLTVPETRNNPGSRLIHLPVLRVYGANRASAQPLFTLGGGPGHSNISVSPSWYHQNHDVVMVGYRGVDGSVSLDCPDIWRGLVEAERPLSEENLEKLGRALYARFQGFREEGIDIDSYTMVDVVDDMEAARQALGYHTVNLWGHSYGSYVAYTYSLRYPDSIQRCFVSSPSTPGRMCCWEPRLVDELLTHYADLWRQDRACSSRTPDLTRTLWNVMQSLPVEWHGIRVDPDKVKVMSFLNLYNTSSAAQVFDAFVAAEGGDYSGLAFLSAAFEQAVPVMFNWGDYFSKVYSSSDIYFGHDEEPEIDPPDTIIGSPLRRFHLTPPRYGGWPIKRIPIEYRQGVSHVETLVVNGNMDPATPLEYTRDYLMPRLHRGNLVVLAEMGHNDVFDLQGDAYRHLCETFFRSGEVDDSKFAYAPVDFVPAQTFQDQAKKLIL